MNMEGFSMCTDAREYIKEATTGNGVKYRAESGKTHQIYVPKQNIPALDENGNTINTVGVYAGKALIHDYRDSEGHFNSYLCTKGMIKKDEHGNTIVSGRCPICERISAAKAIYDFRYNKESRESGKVGQELTLYMEGDRERNIPGRKSALLDERKAKMPNLILYLLIVKFNINEAGNPTMDKDGLPAFELKIFRLQKSRMEKILTALKTNRMDLAGAEISFSYITSNDPKLVVGQTAPQPVFLNYQITYQYPGVLEKIEKAVAAFDWSELPKAFPELEVQSDAFLQNTMDTMFESWDKYMIEKKTNPNALYLEYETAQQTPSMQAGIAGNGVPTPNMATPGGFMGIPQGGSQMPNGFIPQANGFVPNAQPQAQPQGFNPQAQPQGFNPQAQPQGNPNGFNPQAQPQGNPQAQPQGNPNGFNPQPQPQNASNSQPAPQQAPQNNPNGFNPGAQPQGNPNGQTAGQPASTPNSQPAPQPNSQPVGNGNAQQGFPQGQQNGFNPQAQPQGFPQGFPQGGFNPQGQPAGFPPVNGAGGFQNAGQPAAGNFSMLGAGVPDLK